MHTTLYVKLIKLLIAPLLLLPGCKPNDSDILQTAWDLTKEHPDSALQIINSIDYHGLKTDRERSLYAMASASANTGLNRSLVSDSLLGNAVTFYRQENDTIMAAIAARYLAAHYWTIGQRERADSVLGSLMEYIGGNSGIRWEIMQQELEFAIKDRDYRKAISIADSMISITNDKAQLFRLNYSKMGFMFFLGEDNGAVRLGDSITGSGLLPEKGSFDWREFKSDHAEILDETGQSGMAANELQAVINSHDSLTDDMKLGYYVSLTKFNLNNNDLPSAIQCLNELDSICSKYNNIDDEAKIYIEILHSMVNYIRTGHLSFRHVYESSKKISEDNRRFLKERNTAIESSNKLSAEKYELIISRHRLWTIIMVIIASAAIITVASYISVMRHRRKLADAEEQAETLKEMLAAAANNATEEKIAYLKKVLLQQIGIIKTFAEAPTAQNQDALKKISGLGGSNSQIDSLVNWGDLYKIIDELFENFHQNLVANYRGVFNDKEIQIICMIKAGFSTKEIGVLTRQSSATIYVRKSAIRKKLQAPENSDFIAIIDEKSKAAEDN